MKQVTNRSRRTVLWALLLATVGVLFSSSVATATPMAPELTETPANPNGAAVVNFEFEAAEGDPDAPTGFDCRKFLTSNPPAGNQGWVFCNSPMTYTGNNALANGNWTFEVRGRPTVFLGAAGPATSYSWVQNVTSAPTAAPVFADKPANPETTIESKPFTFVPDDSVTDHQCRAVSTQDPDSAWEPCKFGLGGLLDLEIIPNGEYTIEARGLNLLGTGPSTSYTWTKAVADPPPSVRMSEAVTTKWGPREENEPGNIGWAPVSNAGDINGDGRDDLVSSSSSTDYNVLFTPKDGVRNPNQYLGPELGYKIVIETNHHFTDVGGGYYYGAEGIGDQNGDGVPDLLLTADSPDLSFAQEAWIVYGISDPSDLPICPGSGNFRVQRCQNIDELSPSEGYRLTDGVDFGDWGFAAPSSTLDINGPAVIGGGDINGDGIEDILISAYVGPEDWSGGGTVWVVMGGKEAPPNGDAFDVTTLPADEALRIEDHTPYAQIGTMISGVGDLDGDGLGDIALAGLKGIGTDPITYIYYGKSLNQSRIDNADFDTSDGFRLLTTLFSAFKVENVGDLNEDGTPDLMFGGASPFSDDDEMAIAYTPKTAPADPLYHPLFDESQGYVFATGDGSDKIGGSSTQNGFTGIGDLNGDGIDDQAVGAPHGPVNGVRSGLAYVVFGKKVGPGVDPESGETKRIALGGSMDPESGVAILGSRIDSEFGRQLFSAGDQDDDGIGDFWVSDVESTNLILSKSLMAQILSTQASNLSGEKATLSGKVANTAGEGEAWFEWGATASYGSKTATQVVDGPSTVELDLTGLQPNTTYHYRMAVTDGKGNTKYGEDQTFNSGPLVQEPTPCDADPTKPGCPDYNHCAVVPADCQGGDTKARLAIVPISKKIAVKRGKRGTVQVAVINTGGKVAKGVKVCVKAPKRLVKVKACTKVGNLGSGASRTVKIKVKAKKKRGKAVLKHTAKGNNVSAKRAKTRVVIR